MRTIIFFTIVIVTGSTMSGKENCCEQCCEYLENCCKKGKGEVKEKFYLKKTETANPEKIKKLVNEDWYKAKKKIASFILYEKIDNIVNGGLNENDIIKVTKYKNGFSIDENFIPEKGNTKKWALFEIIYKKKGEEEETVYLYCSDIESSTLLGIFNSCKQHISISVIACDTSKVTNMSSMFYKCSSLTELDLSKFNTKNVTDMSLMFSDCSSLMELDLSNFNTETVTDMYAMFSGCASLQQLNLSKFDTKKVTNMDNMFFDCNSLQTVTFNENLDKNIIEQLNKLGLTESEEEGNKITLKKK